MQCPRLVGQIAAVDQGRPESACGGVAAERAEEGGLAQAAVAGDVQHAEARVGLLQPPGEDVELAVAAGERRGLEAGAQSPTVATQRPPRPGRVGSDGDAASPAVPRRRAARAKIACAVVGRPARR